MTDQLTDDALAKRAERLADDYAREVLKGNGWPGVTDKAKGFEFATLDALKVHLDGLRVLERCNHNLMCPANPLGRISSEEVGDCNCGLDQHIASLKQLLGVSQ